MSAQWHGYEPVPAASAFPTGFVLSRATLVAPVLPDCYSISVSTFMDTFGGAVRTPDLALTFLPAQPFQKAILLLLCACDAFPFGSPNFISKTIVSGPAPASAFKLIYQHTLLLPSLVQFLLIQQSNLCPHFPTFFFPHPTPFPCSSFPYTLPNEGRMDKSWQQPQPDAMSRSL